MNFIKQYGIEEFIKQQKRRIELLETMLKNFDDGKSKSFYCIATILLPITALEAALKNCKQKTNKVDNIKTRANILKEFLKEFAAKEGTELKLRNR